MNHQYRVAKGWRFLVYASCLVMIPLFIWVGTRLLSQWEQSGSWLTLLLMMVPVGMVVLMGCGLLEMYRAKVTRQADRVIVTGAFGTKQLLLSQIKGYKIEPNCLVLVPVHERLPTLKISTYLGQFEDLAAWLSEHFSNLDLEEQAAQVQLLLTDEDLGTTAEERAQKLNQARRTATVLNYSGFALALWAMLKPYPYELLIGLCLAVPILALLALHGYKGFIQIDENHNSVHPSVGIALLMPPCALGLRAVLDFEVLEYRNIWMSVVALTLLLVALLVMSTREFDFSKAGHWVSTGCLCLFVFGYCYGGYVIINCLCDRSVPQTYPAGVVKKRTDRDGFIYSYHLTLTAWGPRKEAKEVSVPEAVYGQVREGGPVNVYVRKGLLGVPWFSVATQ
jgi:hypothetical protein